MGVWSECFVVNLIASCSCWILSYVVALLKSAPILYGGKVGTSYSRLSIASKNSKSSFLPKL